MEIYVRQGQDATVTAIRFHDAASLKEVNASILAVVKNTVDTLVAIPKATVDAFVLALQSSKKIFPE